MAMVNLAGKWLYVFERHTASRATARTLQREFSRVYPLGKHHDAASIFLPPHNYQGWEVLCTIRNPFDVLVTRWKYGPLQHVEFREYVQRLFFEPEITEPMMGLWKGATNIVYYEHLNESLSRVFGRGVVVPRDNSERTPGKADYLSYYTGEKAIVQGLLNHYAHFMERFGYKMEFTGDQLRAIPVPENIRKRHCVPLHQGT